ncbi:ABC transporter permease [Granulicella cerasi]|uniref:ABC transporter permease n=1 Tax=Granulicella cerasi TaxID=741063 RepID=A0ABW1ZBI2_9BACT|nr:ABC transporter permease subunit [Granulicella cerasi]
MRKLRQLLKQSWAVVLLLALWQLWVSLSNYNSIVVVAPLQVVHDIVTHPRLYLLPTLWTLGFSLGGLAIGMTAGVMLAVFSWRSRLLGGALQAGSLVLLATPVVCLIPILARMFGYTSRTELLTVALMTFFPGFVYGAAGLRRLPRRTGEFFQTLAASSNKRLLLLALPSAMPDLAVALRVGTASSVLVTVTAEYLMQTGGLGNLFAVTMQEFNLRRALGASIVAMVLSTILYELASHAEKHIRLRFR